MKVFSRVMTAIAALSLAGASVASAQVTVGSPNTVQPNNFPFGSSVGFNTFQQVYGAGLFSGPLTINSISLYNTRGLGNFQVGTFNLFLSTTTVASNAVTNTPANNRTGALQAFSTVSYTAGTAVPGVVTFLGLPYSYDPTAGNLLFEVQFVPNGFNTAPAFFDVVETGDADRMMVGTASNTSPFFGTNGRANYGFVTTFDGPAVSVVPEPGTYAMLGMGLTALLLVSARRRRTN
ncbi:MAG: PEP-CTERM sorting domain-containing protein [Phycisphaerae bacterium]|nr:PEP-CTERM sorting domain-containing protein [Gemmatimonadaceae bacterium]